MAANILEFARQNLPRKDADQFKIFQNMRTLFRKYMTENCGDGFYHCIKPWKKGLWDSQTSREKICEVLNGIWSGTGNRSD